MNDKSLIDITDKVLTASQFGWGSFFRLLILIIILTGLCTVIIFVYYNLKKKTISKPENNDYSSIIYSIPEILKIVERMAEYQQETIYRVIGYISQERLTIIIKRYVKGFSYFCKYANDMDEINREFDVLVDDISKEMIDPNKFKCFIYSNHVYHILHELKDENSVYKFQKRIEKELLYYMMETIKESKKVSYVEVVL